MKLPRRQFLHLAAGAAALSVVSQIASARTYRSATADVPGGHCLPVDGLLDSLEFQVRHERTLGRADGGL